MKKIEQNFVATRIADNLIESLDRSLMLGAAFDCMSQREIEKLRDSFINIIEEEIGRA